MAKIMIEFDTIEKKMSTTIDGKPMENVVDASFGAKYKDDSDDEDEFYCSLTSVMKMKDSGMQMMTRIVASESAEGKPLKGIAKESEEFKGFLEVEAKSKAQTDIENFFI